ncbi:RDD family protein [Tsukamurella sp. 8F]|uniref:RDD family protein n=1 Tax=unclassified Tsukamurella TaxID=2633480 RepID=UPI0023B9A785|nr:MULTISPECIES: RDD family protein [unclassified Tsukamurella]MDF0529932.1 RDD family protein [Tsukamurella sp. 8J]MDF0587296.1 RDD family protein [Tsukamurella sp. 8F]
MGRTTGSWLSGASAALPPDAHGAYKGAGVGLPERGVGSVASAGQRVLALFVDWVPCGLIAAAVVGYGSNSFSLATLALWYVVGVVSVTLFGFSPGQYFTGIRVARVEGAGLRVGLIRALARGLFIVFLVPPLLQDGDGRGMHDRATGTVLIRAR